MLMVADPMPGPGHRSEDIAQSYMVATQEHETVVTSTAKKRKDGLQNRYVEINTYSNTILNIF